MTEKMIELFNQSLDGNLEQKIKQCMKGTQVKGVNSCTYVDKDGILTVKECKDGLLEFNYKFRKNLALHKDIKDFKRYIDNLDDDIFINACEQFGKEKLSELDKLIIKEEDKEAIYAGISDFKEFVIHAAICKALDILKNSGVEVTTSLGTGIEYCQLGVTNINELD